MKKMAVYAGSIVLVTTLLFATSWSWAGSGVEEFPSIFMAENRYDFGVIGEGIEVSHDFIIENRGSAILKFEPIQLC